MYTVCKGIWCQFTAYLRMFFFFFFWPCSKCIYFNWLSSIYAIVINYVARSLSCLFHLKPLYPTYSLKEKANEKSDWFLFFCSSPRESTQIPLKLQGANRSFYMENGPASRRPGHGGQAPQQGSRFRFQMKQHETTRMRNIQHSGTHPCKKTAGRYTGATGKIQKKDIREHLTKLPKGQETPFSKLWPRETRSFEGRSGSFRTAESFSTIGWMWLSWAGAKPRVAQAASSVALDVAFSGLLYQRLFGEIPDFRWPIWKSGAMQASPSMAWNRTLKTHAGNGYIHWNIFIDKIYV